MSISSDLLFIIGRYLRKEWLLVMMTWCLAVYQSLFSFSSCSITLTQTNTRQRHSNWQLSQPGCMRWLRNLYMAS